MNDLEKPGKCPVCEKTNICSYEGDEYYSGGFVGGYAAVGCRLCGYELRKFGATEAEVISIWNRLSLSPAASVGDVFKVDGLTYKILTGSTVQVGDGTNPAISTSKTECVIPATVSNGGTSYTVTSIGDDAFSWCHGLTSLTLPESLTSIGSSAFHWCSGLTSVTFPASLTSIGSSAFRGCNHIVDICFSGVKEPFIGKAGFSNGPSNRILYVPNATSGFTASKWGATEVVYERAANCNHLNT